MDGWKRETVVSLLTLVAIGLAAGCGISTDGSVGPDPGAGSQKLRIKDLQAGDITDTEATITWSTAISTVGTLQYGLDASMQLTETISIQAFDESHELVLDDLEPQTTYYYRVAALSARGDTASAKGTPFTTLPDQELFDSTPPVIYDIEVVGVTSGSAEIHWKTDDNCRCRIHYDLARPFQHTEQEFPADPTRYARSHSLVLTDLTDASTYLYAIEATNKADLSATTLQDLRFTTLSKPTLAICPDSVDVAVGAIFDLGICILNAQDVHGVALILEYDPTELEIFPDGVQGGSGSGPDFLPTGGHIIQPVTELPDGRFGVQASWAINYAGNTALGTDADGDIEFYRLRCRLLTDAGAPTITFYQGILNGDPDPVYPTLYDYHRLPMSFHLEPGVVRVVAGSP